MTGRAGKHRSSDGDENEYVFINNSNFNPELESLLRRAYREVYLPVFPLDGGGEPIERWLEFLSSGNMANEYRIIIAGQHLTETNGGNASEEPVFKAITVSNYYQDSDTGLLGYVTVRPEFRTEGLGMKMVDLQAEFLRAASNERGKNLRGWYLGCYDPVKTDHNYGGYAATRLVQKYLDHGLKTVPIDYALPATINDGGKLTDPKVRYYMLMAAPHPQTGEFPDDNTTLDFIRSIYQDLGEADADSDPDFQEMARQLRGGRPVPVAAPAPRFPGP